MPSTSTRSTSSATTAAAASRRSSLRCIRSACARSRSPTATCTTTGRRRPSSRSWRWRRPAASPARSTRCSRTRRLPLAAGARAGLRAPGARERRNDRDVSAAARAAPAAHAATSSASSRRSTARTRWRSRRELKKLAGADAHRLGHRRRLLRREVVARGSPRRFPGRPAGWSSTAPASSSPKSGGPSSTGCCANTGRPPDPGDARRRAGSSRSIPPRSGAGSARPRSPSRAPAAV